MKNIEIWWGNDLPKPVKFVLLVLLANALPAFIILMTLPGYTELLFVWTVKPIINARLVGVMYGNALLLIAIALFQQSWERVRVFDGGYHPLFCFCDGAHLFLSQAISRSSLVPLNLLADDVLGSLFLRPLCFC